MMLMPNSRPVRRTSPQHVLAPGGVETGGRLIQQHQDRIVDQGLAQLHPLLHSGGVLPNWAVTLLLQTNVPEDVGGAGTGLRRWETGHLGHVREELGGAGRRGQAVVLGHIAQSLPHLRRVVGPPPHDLRGAGCGADQPQRQLDGGALSRPVGAQQPGYAVADLKVDRVQGQDGPVLLGQGFCFKKDSHWFHYKD